MNQERLDAIQRLKKQVQDYQIQNNDKVVRLVDKYETEIAGLKNRIVELKRSADQKMKSVVGNLQKSHHLQVETVKDQYEQKLSEVNDQHQKQLDSIQRKHKEQVDNVLSAVKNNQA